MRILFVAENFLPEDLGGATISARDLATEIGKNHELVVFAPGYGKFEGFQQAENFRIFWYRNRFTMKGALLQQKFLFFAEMSKHLAKFVRMYHPEIIHGQNLYSGPSVAQVSRMYNVVGTVHVRDHRFECFTTRVACRSHRDATILEFAKCAEKRLYTLAFPYARLVTRRIRKALAACGRAFVISNYLKGELLQNVGTDARMVYGGVDLEKIKRIEPADEIIRRYARRRIHDTNSMIVYAGGLNKFKGIFELLDGISQVRREKRDVLLLVVGDGPDRKAVYRSIRDNALEENVALFGSLPHHATISLIKSSAFVVVPSLLPEGASLVAMEGLACGKPALGSNVGAVPEILGNAGLTFTPRASDIAGAVLTLLNDRDKIDVLGRLAIARSQMFSIVSEAREIVRTYKEWLRG